jgi:hypothetical protein
MQGPRRHVFITGIARSGTTLVANLLHAQPHVTIWSDALQGALAAAQRCGGFARTLSARERNIALSWVDHELQHLPLRPRIKPADFSNVRELYARVLEAAAKDDDWVVGHKVNGHGPHGEVFWRLLEETEVYAVCVIRDIRDVVLSQSNHLHASVTPFDHWRALGTLAARLRAHPRVIVIKFEDLIRDPAAAVRPLSERLGIPITTELTELRYADQPWLENSAFHDVDRLFDPRALARWRDHRSDPLVREAAFRCQAELALLGYPEFGESFSLVERARFIRRAARARGIAQLGRLRRRLAAMRSEG